MMSLLWHRLQHALGWNTGYVESWYESKRLMIGFRCDYCGRLSGVHESTIEKRP